jgi:D-alanyl-lipoteichoic acid acyltransferase DltB (MBOAT superfamily)
MLFNSWIFAGFMLLFLPVYVLLRGNVVLRNSWLLVSSYVFYGWWNPRFVTLLAILAAVDYLAALGVAGLPVTQRDRLKCAVFMMIVTAGCALFTPGDGLWLLQVVGIATAALIAATYAILALEPQRRRRGWLYLSVAANLGVLAYFKYCNFFIDSATSALAQLGWDVGDLTLKVVLPIGLSFHVFQGLSRTADCYRGVIKPEGSLRTVAAYLSFFPQLVAGPIERASHLIPQFETVRRLDWQSIRTGSLLFLWGLFMKLVVADNAAPIANAAFENAATVDAATALAGILAFTVQIYGDFSGYSNMARGLARCLGFDLMANFDFPYFARTPSEFWRRWHISLSTWLRDYLYIGLGGNRGGEGRTYRNLFLTMLLGGLWHGAAWTFIVWGAVHGLILILYRALRIDALLERRPASSFGGLAMHGVAWAVMMGLVMIGWVFFRAESFGQAQQLFAALFRDGPADFGGLVQLAGFALPLFVVESYQRFRGVPEALDHGPFLWRFTTAVVVVMAVLLVSAPPGQDFIYFDF